MVIDVAALLPAGFMIHIWGDGDEVFKRRLESNSRRIIYNGPYKSFEYIDIDFDFMWFTSEREGMPNVVKEALAAGIPVLARGEKWVEEMPGVESYPGHWSAQQVADLIQRFEPESFIPKQSFNFESAIPRAMFAFKEALV